VEPSGPALRVPSRHAGAAGWLALTCVSLPAVSGIALLTWQHQRGFVTVWLGKGLIAALVAVPYGLYRFSGSFTRHSARLDRTVLVATAGMVALVMVMPAFDPAPRPTGWTLFYGGAYLAFWVVLAAGAARGVWKAGVHRPRLAQSRVRTMALGSLLSTVAVTGAFARHSGALIGLAEASAAIGGALLYLGLRAPAWLRNRWRRAELARFVVSDPLGTSDDGAEEMNTWFLRWVARLLGGQSAFIVEDGRGVTAVYDIEPAEAASLVPEIHRSETEGTFQAGSCVASRINGGWFVIALSPVSPPVGKPELELMSRLAARADLVRGLQDLLEAERLGRTELAERERELAHRAQHDALTGLPNRQLFLDRLRQRLKWRRRGSGRVAVFFVDLDRFKWINDSMGHRAGDQLLATVAKRLTGASRPGDTVARFGGDEFLVMCGGVPTEDEAVRIGERLLAAVAVPCRIHGSEITPTASIGIVVSPEGDADAEALVGDADAAMYQAKVRGRSRVALFGPDLRSHGCNRVELEADLRRALAADDIEVHYQPEMDLVSGEVAGLEALVRLRHPTRGLVYPGEFIVLAEETGLIVPLGMKVLVAACAHAAVLDIPPERDFTVAVNLSGRQLLEPRLAEEMRQVLMETGLAPGRLRLEITESVLLGEDDGIAEVLHQLKDIGVQIAVDDFGTGYSSLTYLKRFPVDVLKVDASFVQGVADNQRDHAIVASVIDLAHAFGLITTAEGIETAAQLECLRGMGCDLGQGYLWSPAMPPREVPDWIGQHHTGSALEGVSASGSILIVDDDRTARAVIRTILEDDGRFLVHEAGDGREAIVLARRYQPDLVLLDLAMPGMGGIDALPSIRAASPRSRVVVMSALDYSEAAAAVVQNGAIGYVDKTRELERLTEHLGLLPAS
jgi:diguanylate cyclase (GGDEF)-like protein